MPRPGLARKIAGWVILGLVCGLMTMSALMKILQMQPAELVQSAETWGLADKMRLIGVGELLTALLLLIPLTSSAGVLLASSYWGGAICIHLAHDESFLIPLVLLIMTWVGAYLRNPVAPGQFADAPAGNKSEEA